MSPNSSRSPSQGQVRDYSVKNGGGTVSNMSMVAKNAKNANISLARSNKSYHSKSRGKKKRQNQIQAASLLSEELDQE